MVSMEEPREVLFVCLHGSAKSVVAAQLLRRFAKERGLGVSAYSAGVEPDDAVPPHVIAGLQTDGIDVSTVRPQPVTRELIASAQHVVSFGCDLSALGAVDPRRWDDVPPLSEGYAAARDLIATRVHTLLDEIT